MLAKQKLTSKSKIIKSFLALVKKDFLVYSPLSYKGSIKKYLLKIFFLLVTLMGMYVIWKYILNIHIFSNIEPLRTFVPSMIGLYLLISIMQVAFSEQSITFLAKDETLQTLPVPPLVIYLSRIVSKLIDELLKTIFFFTPFLIAIYQANTATLILGSRLSYSLRCSYLILIMPIISILLGSVFQPALVYLKQNINRSNIAYLCFIAIVLSTVIILYIMLIGNLQDNFGFIRANRIREQWRNYDYKIGSFVSNNFIIKNIYPLIFNFQKTTSQIFFINRVHFGYHFLVITALIVTFAYLATLVIYLTYYDLINFAKPRGQREGKPKHLFTRVKKTFNIFFLKELLMFYRDKKLFRTQMNYLLIVPTTMFMVNYLLSSLDLNNYGIILAIIINVVLSVLLVSLSNFKGSITFSADGLSNETIKKMLPDGQSIIWAKLTLALINFLVVATISFIMLIIFNPFYKYLQLTLYLIGGIIITGGFLHLLLSFTYDLKSHNYKLNEALITDSKSVSHMIGYALGITILMLTCHFLFPLTAKGIYLGQTCAIVLNIIFSAIVLTRLIIYSKVVYNRPEGFKYE